MDVSEEYSFYPHPTEYLGYSIEYLDQQTCVVTLEGARALNMCVPSRRIILKAGGKMDVEDLVDATLRRPEIIMPAVYCARELLNLDQPIYLYDYFKRIARETEFASSYRKHTRQERRSIIRVVKALVIRACNKKFFESVERARQTR